MNEDVTSIIVVLGSPNDDLGNLSSMALERCVRAVGVFQEDPTSLILPTGGWGKHFNTTDTAHGDYVRRELVNRCLPGMVLFGYSISGPVISGVAEKAKERIGHLVYLDAYVLEDRQSLADQVGAEIMAGLEEAARMYGDGWRLPHDPPDADRRTDQSLIPVPPPPPLAINNPAAATLPRTFIYCTQGGHDLGPLHIPIDQAAEKAKVNDNWRYRELNTGHMPMWTAPQALVAFLLELA